MLKDVSFIMPIYKPDLKWLEEAVLSIIRVLQASKLQTELLLGNDGTPFDISQELLRYQTQFPEYIRVFDFAKNEGIGKTSMKLFERSCGRYISSFDCDDILLPFDLDAGIRFLDEHPEYSASYASKYLFNEKGLTGDVHGFPTSDFLMFFQPYINVNAILIRREFLETHESFKPVPYSKINQDAWLITRIAADGRFYYSPTPRTLYRIHEKSIVRQTQEAEAVASWRMIHQHLVTEYPELYRKLLTSPVIIPEGKDEIENKLIRYLCGLAFFVNQNVKNFCDDLIYQYMKKYPDDYGVIYVQLERLAYGERMTFEKLYDVAIRKFAGNDFVLTLLLEARLVSNRNWKIQEPETDRQYNLLKKKIGEPPEIVRNAMAKRQQQQNTQLYNFNQFGNSGNFNITI
mgnify:CR=1 FL=1